MTDVYRDENTMKFTSFYRKAMITQKKWSVHWASFYKLVLFLNDFILTLLGVVLGLWLTGMELSLLPNMIQSSVILAIYFVAISFF